MSGRNADTEPGQAKFGELGVVIVGIAMDEPGRVRAFLATHRLNYPVRLGHLGAPDSSRQLGDTQGSLPYSVLLDADGRVQATHVDATRRVWKQLLHHEHPCGAGPFFGPQWRYLIRSEAGWVAAIDFAAAARRLGVRDPWIGWDDVTWYGRMKLAAMCEALELYDLED